MGEEDEEVEVLESLDSERKEIKKTLPFLQQSQEGKKLITDENKEEARVGLKVYKKYQQLNGGWWVFALIILMMIVFIVFKMLGDYWIGLWAKSMKGQTTDFGFYCGMIFLFTFLTSGIIFLRTILYVQCNLRLGASLHNDMIKRVLQAPINLYYDVTPVGRILNKFSKDLSQIDTMIFWMIGT
jgi:ABC-type multidrug transport system fused ATPase/permease subunit